MVRHWTTGFRNPSPLNRILLPLLVKAQMRPLGLACCSRREHLVSSLRDIVFSHHPTGGQGSGLVSFRLWWNLLSVSAFIFIWLWFQLYAFFPLEFS